MASVFPLAVMYTFALVVVKNAKLDMVPAREKMKMLEGSV